MTSPSPPWGTYALERYVLAHWHDGPSGIDRDETQNLDAKRLRLVRQFVRLGEKGRVPYTIGLDRFPLDKAPPRCDWNSVLSPLRTERQRKLASPTRGVFDTRAFGIIWVRTYYGPGSDEAHAKMLGRFDQHVALDVAEGNVLDDVALYDYGDDWHRVFDVIPERLFAIDDHGIDVWSQSIECRLDMISSAHREMINDIKEQPEILGTPINMQNFRALTGELHEASMLNWLFVADETSMRTREPLIVFYDSRGRTIRSGRIQAHMCQEIAGGFEGCMLQEMDEFAKAEIGDDYLPGGVCGPFFTASQIVEKHG